MTATHVRPLGLLCTILVASALPTSGVAGNSSAADRSVGQFLARGYTPHAYRATRRLEATNGNRSGWLEAVTEYSLAGGFRYQVTAEGGSSDIRSKVLRAVLDGERDVITRGEGDRATLAPANYTFTPQGVSPEGLVAVSVVPRRKERALVNGTMFLRPEGGVLVRLQGRLAKNPSFWIKSVDIVRSYEQVAGVIVPITLDSHAQVRLLGAATFRMTYSYEEIDGRPVRQ